MKNLFRQILGIWFGILFVGFYLLMFPFYVILLSFYNIRTHNLAHKLNKIWAHFITFPTGVSIRVHNRDALNKQQPYIFAANHSSYLDIPICNMAIPGTFRFLGKAELTRIWLFGYMFNRLHIAVNRTNRMDAYKSYQRAKDKIGEGISVMIFPEATIPDKTKIQLGRFKDGAFRVAIENQVPIVPMTILNADCILPDDGNFRMSPGRIEVYFHQPIETKGMVIEQVEELKKKVYNIILGQIESADSLGIYVAQISD